MRIAWLAHTAVFPHSLLARACERTAGTVGIDQWRARWSARSGNDVGRRSRVFRAPSLRHHKQTRGADKGRRSTRINAGRWHASRLAAVTQLQPRSGQDGPVSGPANGHRPNGQTTACASCFQAEAIRQNYIGAMLAAAASTPSGKTKLETLQPLITSVSASVAPHLAPSRLPASAL